MEFDLEALVALRVKRASTQLKALKVLQGKDKEVTAMTEDLSENLDKLRCDISELREIVDEYKKQNITLADQQADVRKLLHRIEFIENNLPANFVSRQKPIAKHSVLQNGCAGDVGIPTPSSVVDKRNGTHIPKCQPNQVSAMSRKGQTNGQTQPDSRQYCQLVKHLTQDEFDNMPSYLKGRAMLTYAAVSKFIDYINTALSNKYRVIHSPRTVREKQAARHYKEQETKDTKGVYFVTEEDLKENLNLHYSHNAQQSIWGILRSYQRTREIRGQKLIRFAVIADATEALK